MEGGDVGQNLGAYDVMSEKPKTKQYVISEFKPNLVKSRPDMVMLMVKI